MSYRRCLTTVRLLLGIALTTASLGRAAAQLEPGKKLPPVKITTLDGQSTTLQALCRQNQAVVLDFWAKFLPVSGLQLPAMEKLNQKYSPKAKFIGLALDLATKKDLDTYLKQKRLKPPPTFPQCGTASAKAAASKLGVVSHPTVAVVNRAGVVAYVETGFGKSTAKSIEDALKRTLGIK